MHATSVCAGLTSVSYQCPYRGHNGLLSCACFLRPALCTRDTVVQICLLFSHIIYTFTVDVCAPKHTLVVPWKTKTSPNTIVLDSAAHPFKCWHTVLTCLLPDTI